MAKLRQMMLRLEPTAEEVALLRGMFRQLRWAIGRNSG
jgi:tRNA C32,U32 (ribose-2'-O)-methylase TrmJ